MNSQSRLEVSKPSHCTVNILSDADTLQYVVTLRHIFESCLGPKGHCKLIHNGIGGHVTLTSSAHRLLQCIPVRSPVLRLVTSAVENHCAMYKDGGTSSGTLSLLIIEKGLKMSAQEHQLMAHKLDDVLQRSMQYMNSDTCPVRKQLMFDQIEELLHVVLGVVSTKPTCGLSTHDIKLISCCILRILLSLSDSSMNDDIVHSLTMSVHCHQESSTDVYSSSVNHQAADGSMPVGNTLNHQTVLTQTQMPCLSPSKSCTVSTSQKYTTVVILGHAVSNSFVMPGTLIEASCSLACSTNTTVKSTESLNVCEKLLLPLQPNVHVSVAVFCTSLAGDCLENIIATDTIELDSSLDMDTFMADILMKLAVSVVEIGADVVICQKVIKPSIKRYLRQSGILVFDRVGSKMVKVLAKQTGAQLIGTLLTPVSVQQLGQVDKVIHVVIEHKSYACFTGHQSACSLVLCAPVEQITDELKMVCETANSILCQAIASPFALIGGGVWQRHLATYLRSLVSTHCPDMKDMSVAVCCVADCLERVASVIDGSSSFNGEADHSKPGASGVLDLMSVALNGLRSALLLAQLVLGIGHYVCDAT